MLAHRGAVTAGLVKSAVFSADGQQLLTDFLRQDSEGVVGCLG